MMTMEVCFDGMNTERRHLTQPPFFQDTLGSEMNQFTHYNGYNDSTLALQDCFTPIHDIMTPVAGPVVIDPFNFVSDQHCHYYHTHHQNQGQDHRYHQEQQQQQQQQQQQVYHVPYYQTEQHCAPVPGQQDSANASPELEIPNALPRTTLTWVPTPTPTLQSPAPSPPFRHDQVNAYPCSSADPNSSSQPKLGKNATQPKRRTTEKKSSTPLTPPVTVAFKTSKKKRPQKSMEGSKKSSMTSRMKSKEWLRNIESISKQLEAQYDNLKAEHERLLQETLQLKSDLICHAKCRDARLDAWINNEARKFVSAPGRSYDDAQPSPTDWGMSSGHHFVSMSNGAEDPWSVGTA
ncbi:hypothetical protein E4U42_002376 [Claviceps africana]|uniref:BZIP domain-containing protein n=1 Tax=Claviceps africana TaxID=83212 RepID=A0A8K0NMB2_9HYPO|nr:hypothetical protein E4U42_002376 [Claviceps africana]